MKKEPIVETEESNMDMGSASYRKEWRYRPHHSFFWPLLLIVIGTLLLLNNMGVLPWAVWDNIWRFWPLILILFGLEILLGKGRFANIVVTLIGLIILITILSIYVPGIGDIFNQTSLHLPAWHR